MSVIFALIALVFLIFTENGAVKAFTFLIGACVSSGAGYIGMMIATQTNGRTANLAQKSFFESFRIALLGGEVMGFLIVGLGLLGISLISFVFNNPQLLISYAFGSSLVALFMRLGGGIYTKSADIGADMVGKVEKGIPEDDPRNPAVIADAVGDNVGDIAGMGSDLLESFQDAIIVTVILGIPLFGQKGLILPMLLAGAGILASIISSYFITAKSKIFGLWTKTKGEKEEGFNKQTQNVRKAINKGFIISNVLMLIACFFISRSLIGDIKIFWVLAIGLLVGFLLSQIIQYFTSSKYKPVLSIAKASKSGASTNIIEGLSQGIFSAVMPTIIIAAAIVLAYNLLGLFGIALASVGILLLLGINLSTDSYGPIADNAAGISEMAGLSEKTKERTDSLDAVGNTTAAMGKGFAIGSAGLTALAWLAAYFELSRLKNINIIDPKVLAGVFIGVMLSFLFAALSMKSVSKGASLVVKEVRRQFKEIPGLLKGKAKPDYSKCVDLITKHSLKNIVLPALLVVLMPILIGIILGIAALGGFLAGTVVSGFLLAQILANSGGAWDNAKKYIEAGNLGGEGSQAHKAAVIGDTVGDPFKDTAGPSLNILIKLIGKVAILFIPLFLLI